MKKPSSRHSVKCSPPNRPSVPSHTCSKRETDIECRVFVSYWIPLEPRIADFGGLNVLGGGTVYDKIKDQPFAAGDNVPLSRLKFTPPLGDRLARRGGIAQEPDGRAVRGIIHDEYAGLRS